LFDFSGDLYGQELEICFGNHLRPEMKFPSLEALRDQISMDVAAARESLA
jgi:riboflavin kinase/FMN adenylyltransferase